MRGACFERHPDCPYERHYSDVHHDFYPGSDYKTVVERTFRELPENKQQLCRYEHDLLHLTEQPPEKPSRAEMIDAISESDVFISVRKRKVMGMI